MFPGFHYLILFEEFNIEFYLKVHLQKRYFKIYRVRSYIYFLEATKACIQRRYKIQMF